MKREVYLKRSSVNIRGNNDNFAPYIIELANFSKNEEEAYQSQTDFLASMDAAGIKFVQRARFSGFFNAISGRIHTRHLDHLHEMPQVKAIWPVVLHKRHAPIRAQPTNGLPTYLISNSFNSTSVDKVHSLLNNTGAGIKVGIIDTGIDYKHPALGGCFGPGCRVRYGWDFVGSNFTQKSDEMNPGPDPMDCAGHGTHVAGIVGANGHNFTGVAPDVILGAYRVFGCDSDAPTDAIIQAIEMAVKDEMDIINLSLGTNSPFPTSIQARMVDYASSRGILVVVAAGNEGTSGQWTIGEPSTASSAISVASFESPTFPGQKVILDQYPEREMIVGYANPRSFSFSQDKVSIAKYDGCQPLSRLDGAVAIIDLTLATKDCDESAQYLNAEKAGARGIITSFFSDEPTVPITFPPVTIPIIGANAKDFTFILRKLRDDSNTTISTLGSLQLYPSPYANTPSVFSSWGPDFELNLKPDIGAPGGNIYSTYPLDQGGYAYLDGTSMASPYLAGSSALILKAHREAGLVTDVNTLRKIIISSGVPSFDAVQTNRYVPVGKQGAGLINVWNAIHTTTLVSPPKISLNDTVHANLRHVVTITNNSTKPITYGISHQSAMSVNGYDANGLPLTPVEYLFSDKMANIIIDSPEVTVGPRQSARVELQFVPPTFESSLVWIYSGYIFIVTSDGTPSVVVPYVGVVGDMSKLNVIDVTGENMPTLLPSGLHSNQSDLGVYDFRNGKTATLSIPLINPTKRLAAYVINEQNDFVGHLSHEFDVGRSLDEWFQLTLTGNVESDTELTSIAIPNGRYHVVVEALKPFTNNVVDKWVSPLIEILNF